MTVAERFLKLVSFPTTSDESSETCPSTARQLDLARELVRQMQDMGIADAQVNQDGYVYGTIPANCEKTIPVYGLIAHMDTAPDAPGENIRTRVTERYDGGDVVLNEEKQIVLSPKEYPQLKNSVGKHLIVCCDGIYHLDLILFLKLRVALVQCGIYPVSRVGILCRSLTDKDRVVEVIRAVYAEVLPAEILSVEFVKDVVRVVCNVAVCSFCPRCSGASRGSVSPGPAGGK